MSLEPIDDQIAADAEPAAERITLALMRAIDGIRKLGGFWDDVKVARPNPANPEPVTHAGIEVILDTESKAIDGVPMDVEQIDATYYLICDVVASEAKKVLIDTLINRIKADVKRAVLQDRTLGGLAMDTTFGDAELLEVETSAHGGRVVLACVITYRTLERDPYVLLNNANPTLNQD